ncbi:hypothetical protein MBLNU459_g3849t1 [Dothideomycetes sp. NU459]
MAEPTSTTELTPMAGPQMETLAISVQGAVPLTPVFRLPRELRDIVYRHLLVGDEVKYLKTPGQDHPLMSTAHSYRFCTNLLAVNKQIREEASEILYKENTFVMVTTISPEFETDRHVTDIPIVSARCVGSLTEHSMRIHFTWETPPMLRIRESKEEDTSWLDRDYRGYILLLQDLPRLCALLQFNYCLTPQNQLVMLPVPGQGATILLPLHENVQMARLRVVLRSTRYKVMTQALQDNLLRPLRNVVAPCQDVVITGGSEDSIKSTIAAMTPRLIWASAVLWDLYTTTRLFKDHADALVRSGQFMEAAERYSFLVDVIHEECTSSFPRDWLKRDPIGASAIIRLTVMLADCTLSQLWIRLRCDPLSIGEQDIAHGLAFCRAPYYGDDSARAFDHFSTLLELMHPETNFDGSWEDDAQFFLRDDVAPAGDEYYDHDAAVIKNMLAQSKTNPEIRLTKEETSACRLSVRLFNTEVPDGVMDRPSDLVGWQDVSHLRAMTINETRYIADMQARLGLKVIDVTDE